MAYTGVVLVLLAVCGIAYGSGGGSTTSRNNATTNGTTTPSMPPTKPNSTIRPTKNVSTPITPKTNGTVTPTTQNTTATPGNFTTRPTTVPSSKPGNHSTTPTVTQKVTPTPEGHGDNKSDKGKWVATGFAVVFFLTTVIMTVLYCRQRRIYRELEGDSSLSRLI